MDKNKEIEEMARVACEHFDCDMVGQPCTKCKTYDKHCYTIHQAEILYNAGYRKVPDCAVILTSKERDEEIKACNEKQAELENEIERLKADAVKEFAEKLKERLCVFFDENENNDGSIDKGILLVDIIGVEAENGDTVSIGMIDDLLKEYENGKSL